MWTLLQSHGDLRSVFETMLEEYDVPRERLLKDLLDFVDRLASRRLLKLEDA